MRCLAKDLKDRFQRAGEIRSTLETIQSAAIVSEPRREEPTGPRTLVLRGIQHLDVKNGDVLLLLGTTKGAFLARSKSDRKHWEVAGPYFHGHAVYSLGVRQSERPSSIVGLDRQPALGHVFALQRRFRQDLDQPAGSQHQISAGVRSRRSRISGRYRWGLRRRRTNSIAAWSRPRCSSHKMQANRGRWCAVCSIIPIGHAGCLARAGCVCTRSCCIRPTPGECMSEFPRQAFTGPMMAAGPGKRATGASASRSCRSGFRSSGNACTRSFGIRIGRIACSCKTTGGCIGPMTARTPGTTSPTVCRRILASPWRLIRTIPTAFTSCPWNRMNFAALPRGGCASIARGTRGVPGSR